MTHDRQNKYYDIYWANQEWRPAAYLSPVMKARLKHHLLSGHSVLDVGCGDGQHYGKFLASIVKSHIGLDVSSTALRSASQFGIKPCLWPGHESMPFKDESFDAAICIEVLEHLHNPEAVVGEMYRVLKPRGKVIVSVPNIAYFRERLLLLKGVFNPGGSPLTAWDAPWSDPHIRFFTPRTIKMLFEKMKFNVCEITGDAGNPVGDLPGIAKLAQDRLIFPNLAALMQSCHPSMWGSKTILIANK